jgi:Putative Ig domain
MVFVNSTDAHASVRVSVDEVSGPGGTLIAGGLAGTVLLNPDPLNPDIANPDIANPDIANPDVYNPDIANPDIANPDIANPDIANPDIANPDIANPDIANPDIANPDIANPDIANPDIANPDIANPDIANPDIANAAISDVTWRLTNKGTATAVYSVDFVIKGSIPNRVRKQLIIHRLYSNPVVNGCALVDQPKLIVISNITEPRLDTPEGLKLRHTFLLPRVRVNRPGRPGPGGNAGNEITDDGLDNPTVTVGPGETIYITLRFYNLDKTLPLGFDPIRDITAISVSHAINTGGTTPPVDASQLIIATTALPPGAGGLAYSQTLVAVGGKPPYTWTLVSGALPPGLSLSPAGAISGTVTRGTPAGNYFFTLQVTDASGGPPVLQDFSIPVSGVALAITQVSARGPNGASVKLAESITVTANVVNTGSTADSVSASIALMATGTASANCGAPSPLSGSIAGGGQATYSFTCANASGSGTLTFAVSLTAIDPASGASIMVGPTSSNSVSVGVPLPVVTAAATANGAAYGAGAWTNRDVVVTFTCTPATGAPVVHTETVTSGAGVFVSYDCTDSSGNRTSSSFGPINIDKTAPVITVSATAGGQPYAGGSTTETVVVIFTCTDPGGSGVVAPTIRQEFSSGGSGQIAKGTCTDLAGNTASTNFGPIDIVSTSAPQISATYKVAASSYSPGAWTMGPVTVTFTCVAGSGASVASVTPPVTVTAEGANQFVNGVCTDNGGRQAQLSAGPINVDRTAPAMTLQSRTPANGAGWNNSNVTVTWLCNDALSGASIVSRTVTTEGANQSVSATCSDAAGNSTSASTTVSIDKTLPVLTGAPTPSVPASGWYRGPVSVAFTCTDALSGVAAGNPTGNTTLNTDTNGTLVPGQCRDVAGNLASVNVGPIRIDTIPPVPHFLGAGALNNGLVPVNWSCTDSGSGPVAASITHNVVPGATDTATCTDVAGNSASATSPPVQANSTPPNVNLLSPVDGFTYQRNSVVFATYLCSDDEGVASCTGTIPAGARIDTSTPGTFTFTVVAIDISGNQTTVTRTYYVN